MGSESIETIDGIGPRRATALREAGYDTVERLRAASTENLAGVRGIGPSLAERIKTDVGEPTAEWGSDQLRIDGRIRAGDDGKGVHGLLVEVWEDAVDDQLGSVRTREDGRFRIVIDETHERQLVDRFRNRPARLSLRVRDRDGSVIYSSDDPERESQIGELVEFDLTLDADRLIDHRSRPTTWDHPGEGLVPDEQWADIEAAVGLLAPPGEAGRNAYLQAVRCPAPPFDRFDGAIFDDAFGAIEGDPRAIGRFRDIVETAQAFRPESSTGMLDGVSEETIEALFEGEAAVQPATLHGADAAGIERTVGPEKVVPLTLAALQIGGGDRDLGGGILGPVLDQFCGAELIGALHRSALDALSGRDGAIERWAGHVGYVGFECGPDDGPIPEFPPKLRPRCPGPPDPCAADVLREVRERDGPIFGGTYRVTEVAPARACPGDVVTIRGSGFGSAGGDVYFEGGATGEVLTWSDTEITVRVPEAAGCGLRLSILADTIEVCGRFIDVYKRGRFDANFEGTAPGIVDLGIDGERGRVCVSPGVDVRVHWETCAADTIEITVEEEDGDVIASYHPSDASGTWIYDVPDVNATRELTVRAHVEGRCYPPTAEEELSLVVHEVPTPTVQGMEVTQAIQHYGAAQHLTDAADRGPDNSLQFAVGKPAWVRVYVRSGQDPGFNAGQLEDVTGTLTLERFSGGTWSAVATLSSVNPGGTITADADPGYAAERGDIDATLNFVIPAGEMRGQLRLSVDTEAPDVCDGPLRASDATTISVTLRQRLRIAGIMVSYNGPDAAGNPTTIAAPTLANLRATAALSYTMMPVANPRTVDFRISGTVNWTQPLTDPPVRPGGCSNNWLSLNAAVRNVMTADSNQAGWVFYGLLPVGIPMGPVIGCGGGAVGTGSNGNQGTMVHEVGHALGLQHGPCGTPGDPNYPAYEPYDPVGTPGARLGPYGLDITDGTIHPPQQRDYMSYCNPPWISKYHHNKLLNLGRLNATTIGGRAVPAMADGGPMGTRPETGDDEPRPFVSITGYVTEADEVVVETVARVRTRADVFDGIPTTMRAELLESGEVVAGATVFAMRQEAQQSTGRDCNGCGTAPDKPPFSFHALLADRVPGDEIRITEGGTVRWRRRAPDEEPNVEAFEIGVEDNTLDVEWKALTHTDVEPEAWLRWSDDDGETWHALTVGIHDERTTVDVTHLPRGPVRFQLLVHDGFFTTDAVSGSIQLPERAPSVTIMHPQESDVVVADAPLRLWGIADFDGEDPPEGVYEWRIDGEVVAEGSDVWIDPPEPGTHEVALRATAEDRTVVEHVSVTVEGTAANSVQ